MKRPIILVTIPFLLGILTSEYLKLDLIFSIILSYFLFILYKKSKKNAIITFIFFLLGFFNTNLRYVEFERLDDFVICEIYEINHSSLNSRYLCKDNKNFVFSSNEIFEPGDIVKVSGEYRKPKIQDNFGVFNYTRYLRSKNVFVEIKNPKISKVGKNNNLKYILRNEIETLFDTHLDKNSASLLKSMMLGYKEKGEIYDEIREIGIAHILAISGLHINILISFLTRIGKMIGISRRKFNIIIVAFLIFYGYIIDFPVSILRALIMHINKTLAIQTNNIFDNVNSIFISIVLLLFINPFFIYSISFFMTLAAAVSIFYLSGKIKILFPSVGDLVTSSISINLIMLPILIKYFSSLNLISIFANIIMIPILSFGLVLGFLFLFVRISLLSEIINLIFYIAINSISPFVNFGEILKIEISGISNFQILLYYFILYILTDFKYIIYYLKKNRKLLYISPLVLFFLIKPILMPVVKVNFIDVGQGDSILIRDGGRSFLYDTGGTYYNFEVGGERLFDYLKKNSVLSLDAVFISHEDFDHYGSLIYLVDNIYIDEIFASNFTKYKNTKLVKGDKISSGNLSFEVLFAGESTQSSNDSSLVILLRSFNQKILLTGDIEQNEKFIKTYEDIDILKVSHHASKHSTTREFLENNRFREAVISVGENRYNHPSKEVIKRLEDENIKVYRTDYDGNVEVLINRFGYLIHSYNQRLSILELFRLIFLY